MRNYVHLITNSLIVYHSPYINGKYLLQRPTNNTYNETIFSIWGYLFNPYGVLFI